MKFILHILHWAYSIYVLLCFFIFMPIILFLYILFLPLPERSRMMSIYHVNRVWFGLWSLITGIWIKVEGKEHIKKDEDYVILLTHNNLLDIPVAASSFLHPFKPLVKKELLKVPLMGQLLRLTSIPVSRSSQASRKESFENMVAHMNRGISVLIFPEGTRNRTEKPLKDFYDGGFKLAIRTQKPVLPAVILNHRELQPVDTFLVKPGTITLKILEPVPSAGLSSDDGEAYKQDIHQRIKEEVLKGDSLFNKPAKVES